MSEEKEVKPTQEEQQETGWRGVQMTPLTPIGDIISFLNVLNQRLATIEDFVFIQDDEQAPDAEPISLTEYYKRKDAEAREKVKEGK